MKIKFGFFNRCVKIYLTNLVFFVYVIIKTIFVDRINIQIFCFRTIYKHMVSYLS